MSLKDAREARDDARKLRTGTDPAQQRHLDKLTRQAVAGITFEAVARELHATKHGGWSPRYAARWIERMEKSEDMADRKLGRSVVEYARRLPGVRCKAAEKQPQRELPGLERERALTQRARPERGWER